MGKKLCKNYAFKRKAFPFRLNAFKRKAFPLSLNALQRSAPHFIFNASEKREPLLHARITYTVICHVACS